MKRIFSVILSAVLACCVLAGCSGSSSSSSSSVASGAVSSSAASSSTAGVSSVSGSVSASTAASDLKDIVSAVEAVNAVSNPLNFDEFALKNDLLLTMENVADFAGVHSNDQGNSATILVIKAAAGKAADVSKELETYKQNQIAYYGNYSEFADGMAQIKDGRVVTQGDYVILVFANTEGASYSEIDKAIDSAIK